MLKLHRFMQKELMRKKPEITEMKNIFLKYFFEKILYDLLLYLCFSYICIGIVSLFFIL